MGKTLGDDNDPLLVSVRSGSPFSMPGMMDTVLNLGLNDTSIQGLIAQTGNERFAWDSYRRFIQMFSKVVLDVEGDLFENAINKMKLDRGVKSDTDLTADDLKELVGDVQGDRRRARPRRGVPAARGRRRQGRVPAGRRRRSSDLAIEAVFSSWMNDRAVYYRKMEKIADDLGTAVNIQTMVFGNKGDTSATGVGFTRNPADGTKEYYGDFLTNAQGEDVVAGIRITEPISDLKTVPGLEDAGRELDEVFDKLETSYRDMCDIEFTIEQGKLWMLQTRIGKRTARAALKIAIDMVDEGMIDREGSGACASTRRSSTSCCTRSSTRRPPTTCSPRASTRARVRPSARSCSPRQTRSRPRKRAARSSSFAGRPTPTTCPAWTPRRASSPRTAARRATRPSSPAAWASRASAASRSSRSTPSTRSPASRAPTSSCTRATSSRSTARPASWFSARSRSSSPRSPATSTRS